MSPARAASGRPWVLVVLTGLLVVGAVALAAVGLASRAERGRRLEEAGQRAGELLAEAQDLLARHPDYAFAEAAGRLQTYRQLSARERGRALAGIRGLKAELELSAVSQATGLRPGAEGWQELLAWKTFSPNGFRDLYEALAAPATGEAPAITGSPEADGRIARLARARGYRLRAEAEAAELQEAGGGRRLRAPAAEAFRRLQAEAAAQGVGLELVSGFRDAQRQRAIFLSALAEQGRRTGGGPYTAAQIASGQADRALEAVLAESAPPGFSRHHTGLAMDLNDPTSGRPFTQFGETPAYRWLAAANYRNAKRFGFIPSYPPGASAQGPDPEPWEFVWVGEEALAAPAAPAAPAGPAKPAGPASAEH